MIATSELRKFVNVGPEDIEYLEFLRDTAIGQLEYLTGKKFNQVTDHVQEIPIVEHQDTIFLGLRPVSSITSLQHRDKDTQTWTTLESTKYNFEKPNRITLLSGCFKDVVKVTYTGGYSSTTVPSKIKTGLIVQIKFLRSRLDPNKIDVRSNKVGDNTTVFITKDQHPIFERMVNTLK